MNQQFFKVSPILRPVESIAPKAVVDLKSLERAHKIYLSRIKEPK